MCIDKMAVCLYFTRICTQKYCKCAFFQIVITQSRYNSHILLKIDNYYRTQSISIVYDHFLQLKLLMSAYAITYSQHAIIDCVYHCNFCSFGVLTVLIA